MPAVQQQYATINNLRVVSRTYSEDELILALVNRDQTAFSYLYDHYAPALNAIICRLIADKHAAEDILQEAFMKIWNNIVKYDDSKGRLFTWMLSITRNLAIDTIRSAPYKKYQHTTDHEHGGNYVTTSSCEFAKFDFLKIDKQLMKLKPDHFRVLDMAYLNGMTHREIADQTGMPIGTIKTKIRMAVLELRKTLQVNELKN